MSLAVAIQIIQFLRAIAPLIPELYATVKATFGSSPGVVKFDAFISQVRDLVPMVEELKPFEPILEQAIPRLKVLVDKYHAAVSTPA